MEELIVKKSPLPWWAAGVFLGLVQVLAIALVKPLGVSTQYVVADAKILKQVAPEYTQNHPLISPEADNGKYQKFGYGWRLNIGLIIGAFLAAVFAGRWKLRCSTIWWQTNKGQGICGRFIAGFIGGFLILLGARFAHGCTSGQFASGWAQLSLSVLPFTVTMFAFGMLAALIVYPKVPQIEK